MRRLAALAALLVISIPEPSLAKPYQDLGPGARSCGAYAQSRATDGPQAPLADTSFFWLQGYLTAYNRYVEPDGNITVGTDAAGLQGWLDNYCQAHPLDDIDTAARALIVELKARKTR